MHDVFVRVIGITEHLVDDAVYRNRVIFEWGGAIGAFISIIIHFLSSHIAKSSVISVIYKVSEGLCICPRRGLPVVSGGVGIYTFKWYKLLRWLEVISPSKSFRNASPLTLNVAIF
jgi:hypothetical protein